MSDHLEARVLNASLNGVAFVAPTSVYLAFFTTLQNDAGTSGVEVVGNNYSRIQLTGAFTIRDLATRFSNTLEIQSSIASGSWGLILGVGLYDALTIGNLFFHGALTISRTVSLDEAMVFAADALGLTLA